MNIFSPEYWRLHKPKAATAAEWDQWRADCIEHKLWAYVIQEEIPDVFADAWRNLGRPYSKAYWWLRYRTTDRNHVLRTGMKPGYHDKPEQMLHVNFQLLVDYVEIECANMATIFLPEWQNQRKNRIKRWLRIPERNPQAGIAYLLEPLEGEGTDTHAEIQREIVSLYQWWCTDRAQRADPCEASGWDEFCAQHSNILNLDHTHDAQSADILARLRDMEARYQREDQEMLHRLIEVRDHLWT